jgi:hypothetical protein
MKILVLLQNAWAYEPAEAWQYDSWVLALRASRSGQRLARIFGPCWDQVIFGNTTAKVGQGPDSRLPPDLNHVRALFNTHQPDIVLACGQQAERVASETWPGPLLCIPHPAYRVLKNSLLARAKKLLYDERPFTARTCLRQGRGRFTQEKLS